jgi:hypothetical protein
MTHTVKTLTVGLTPRWSYQPPCPARTSSNWLDTWQLSACVESHGLWATEYRTVFYVDTNGPTITLGEHEVHTKQEADELQAADRSAREAKEKAERAMG